MLLLLLAGCERLAGESAARQPDASPAQPTSTASRHGHDKSGLPDVEATDSDITTQDSTDKDVLVPFGGRVSDTATPANCMIPGFVPPQDFRVFAAGAYAGRKLDYQIDQSGHQATRIDVAVNHAGIPVVLMLGAYEPTVWNIGWSKDTQIAAVLLSGYHRQAIAGLPKEVPVLTSSYDNRGPCGYFYVAQDKVRALNPISQRLFGRNVDMVYLANNGSALIGDPLPAAQLVTSSRIAPDSFRDADAPLAGEAGLQDAVRLGLLREARAEDMRAWTQARAAMAGAYSPPIANPIRTGDMDGAARIHNGYVVLKEMRLPSGLYGAHSATFFVPKGVPRPTGDPGHSTIYDFNTMTCAGVVCRARE